MKRWLLAVLIIGIMFSGGWQADAQDGSHPVITPENVPQLTVLQRLGRGSFEYVDWSPDGEHLVIAGSMGLWLYDAHHLEDEPRLLEAYGAKQSLTFSPDGHWVALSMWGEKLEVRLWDLTSGQPGPTMEGGNALFSPDSRLLASREGNNIVLWNVATGEKIRTLEGHGVFPYGLAFSPDSTRLASSWDGSARLWDISTGEVLFEWDDHAPGADGIARVPEVIFTPDGTQVITAGEDGTVRWWDVATGENLRIVEGPFRPEDLKFSPDGSLLALASIGSGLWLWDGITGEPLRVLEDYHCWFVSFSPDGTLLACGGKLWNAATGQLHSTLESCGDTFSPDGTQVAAITADGAAWVGDVATGESVMTLPGIYSVITRDAFSPDSQRLVSSGGSNVWLWDAATGENEQVFRHIYSSSYLTSNVAFSPDGSLIASGDIGYIVRLLDAVTGEELRVFQSQGIGDHLHSGLVDSLIFSPDGARLAFGSWDAGVKVWDVAAGEELYVLGSPVAPVTDLAFSSDGTLLARASVGAPTALWDMSTGEEVCTLQGDEDYRTASSVIFSLDGTLLVEGSKEGPIQLWDVETCQQVRVLEGHTAQVAGLALSPDGRLLASGSWDGTLRLWNITTGEQLHLLGSVNPPAENNPRVGHLAFSPDGTLLAVELSGGGIWLLGIPKE